MGTRGMGRIAAFIAVAVSVGALSTGTALAAPGCTDTYTGADGGGWYTAAAWSAGHVPTPADSVCITQPGTGVGLSNDSITVANLTIGSSSSLSIGSPVVSVGSFTVTGTLINDGSISTNWGGTFTAGRLVNNGTFDVPLGDPEYLSFGNVVNAGTFSAEEATFVTLTNGGTFVNTGTISAGPLAGSLAITSPHPGAGTVELEAGGVVDMTDDHPITVADAVDITGGSLCGAPLGIGSGDGGSGGSLAFAGASGAAPDCSGVSGPSDSVSVSNVPLGLSGTVPAGYSVTVGDDGSSYATVTLAGRVVNDGTLQFGDGAQVFGHGTADTLVNAGTLDVPAAGGSITLDTGLTNVGTFNAAGGVVATLDDGQAWSNGTDGTNATMTGYFSLSNSPGQVAPFTQDGTLEASLDVAEPVVIAGGSLCGDLNFVGGGNVDDRLEWAPHRDPGAGCPAGQRVDVTVYGVQLTLNRDIIPAKYTVTLIGIDEPPEAQGPAQLVTPGPLVNDGTLEVDSGSELTINGTFTNRGEFSENYTGLGSPVTLSATQTLNLGQLLLNGVSLDVDGPVENGGKVKIVGDNHLVVSDDYTQDARGTLHLITPEADPLIVGGTATLAGAVSLASGLPAGTQARIVIDNGTQGTFSTVNGPYTLSYSPTGVTATPAG